MIAFLALGELGVLGANPFRGGGQQIKGQVSYRLQPRGMFRSPTPRHVTGTSRRSVMSRTAKSRNSMDLP